MTKRISASYRVRRIIGKWYCVILDAKDHPVRHSPPFDEINGAKLYAQTTGLPNRDEA